MAAEITFLKIVEDKLNAVGGSSDHIVQSLRIISEAIKSLENKEESVRGLHPELLQAVYLIEHTIDCFLVRTKFQKHNVFSHSMAVFSQNHHFSNKMGKLFVDLQKKWSDHRSQGQLKRIVRNVQRPDKTDILDVEGKANALADFIIEEDSPFHIFVVDDSAMLSKVCKRDDIRKHFEYRAWVHVSDDFGRETLLMDVWKQVKGNKEDNNHPQPLEQHLRQFLTQKKYLIILIDVATPDIWEILKYAFPDSTKGSRIIFSFKETVVAQNPNIRFFGLENLSLKSEDNQVSLAQTKYAGVDTVPIEQKPSESDLIYSGVQGAFKNLEKETDIFGRTEELIELAHRTLSSDQDFLVISVVGIAGSGKTTLVKTFFDYPYVRTKFRYRAWVNVYFSQDVDTIKNALIDILKQITQVKVEEDWPLEKLEKKLTETLSGERFLIVLDNVYVLSVWYNLESRLPKTGCKAILITRNASLAYCLSESIVLFKLDLLGKDEGWKLFLKKAKIDKIDDQDSKNLRETIWKKCHGLPLAICVLGGLLSSKDSPHSKWPEEIEKIMPGEKGKEQEDRGVNVKGADFVEDQSKRTKEIGQIMQQGKEKEQEDVSVNVKGAAFVEDDSVSEDLLSSLDKLDTSHIWALGYRDLPPYLKACLHYLCLFPKSYEIPVRRALHLWIAEGLVKSKSDNQLPEDKAMLVFEQLQKRSMIDVTRLRPDGTPRTCSVPITLHEAICPDSEDMGIFHVHRKSGSTSNSKNLRVHRLAEHVDMANNYASYKDVEDLRSYISFKTKKGDKPADEIGSFLNNTMSTRGFGLLKVLDLERVYKPVLPEKLGNLPLLRYVGLRWTFLDSIPEAIGDLRYLEALDVKHTNVSTLPMSIWKVESLRHLYMNDVHIQIPSEKQSDRQLVTLWGLLIGSKHPSDYWLESLQGLRKLGLTCHSNSIGKITKWIPKISPLQSLRLRSVNDFSEPADLNIGSMDNLCNLTELYLVGKFPTEVEHIKLPKTLKILTLSVSHLKTDPMKNLGELKHLNILRLSAHSYVGPKMTCLKGGFPELRVLKLWVLKELQEWEIEETAMAELRELEIRYCKNLKKINGLRNLTNLKQLKLTNMEDDFAKEVGESLRDQNIVISSNNLEVSPPWIETLPEARNQG